MQDKSIRAGRYVTQPSGYQAFHPSPLPPNPPLVLNDKLQELLSTADRALGRLDGSIYILPNPDLFVAMYARKEAVLSSQIEGTQSSLQDLLAQEARIHDPNRPADVGELVNYVNAMNHGLASLAEVPISIRLLKEMHQLLLQNTRGHRLTPGELRRTQNWIGPVGCNISEATFVPPAPHEMELALSELEKFIHQPTRLPLLIKIGLIHAQFETIHPFLDGNGPIGRLLITILLCEQCVLQHAVLYLSLFFRKHRQQYYETLQSVRDNGAWEDWLVFFLSGIIEVSEQATDSARKILWLQQSHQLLISDTLRRRAFQGLRILDSLYKFPVISVEQAQQLIKGSFQAANTVVNQLVECGILIEITGYRRNRRFEYRDYVRIFEDETA